MIISREHMGLMIAWDGHEDVLVLDGARVLERHKTDEPTPTGATRTISRIQEELSQAATAMEVVREIPEGSEEMEKFSDVSAMEVNR